MFIKKIIKCIYKIVSEKKIVPESKSDEKRKNFKQFNSG